MQEKENKEKNEMDPKRVGEDRPGREKNNPFQRGRLPAPRSSRAAVVWLVLLLAIGSLVLFRGYGPSKVVTLSQSEFERLLRESKVASAVMTAESDRIFNVEGKLRSGAAGSESKVVENKTPENARGGRGNLSGLTPYKTRVIYSERLAELMNGIRVRVDSNNAGLWNFLLVGILPVLLIVGVIYFFTARQMRMTGRGAMDFGKSKARMIPPDELHVKFDDIAGADEAKEEIGEIVEYLKDPLRFQLVGGQIQGVSAGRRSRYR